METVQQNGRFTLFSIKFLSIYSILYVCNFPLNLYLQMCQQIVYLKIGCLLYEHQKVGESLIVN